MKTILFLILLIPMMFTSVFAQTITLDVDTTQFEPGQIVELSGSVPSGLENKVVAVEIKDAGGNVIFIRTIQADADGNFLIKFRVPTTAVPGEFDIVTSIEVEGQQISGSASDQSITMDTESIGEPTCGPGTTLKGGICVIDSSEKEVESEPSSKGGGCLIATATYGSELAPEVQKLREIRDNSLLSTESGTNFMNLFNEFYYSFSPVIADYERENPVFKEIVKIAITPMINSLSILNYVDINSEVEVLGYGISLILLNVGMYIGLPVIVIMRIRK